MILESHKLLSTFAFNFNLRRHNWVPPCDVAYKAHMAIRLQYQGLEAPADAAPHALNESGVVAGTYRTSVVSLLDSIACMRQGLV